MRVFPRCLKTLQGGSENWHRQRWSPDFDLAWSKVRLGPKRVHRAHANDSRDRPVTHACDNQPMSGALLLAFTPWLVFAFASRSGGLHFATAALIALAWSGGLIGRSLRQGHLRAFELVTLLLFSSMALLGFLQPASWTSEVAPYGRAIVACLALIALGSLLVRPFTEGYTRDLVSSAQLETRAFRSANRSASAAWSLGAILLALSFAAGASLPNPVSTTVFNWLLPLLTVLACIHFTARRWYEELSEGDDGWATLDGALALSTSGCSEFSAPRRGRPRLRLLRSLPPDNR